MLEVRFVEASRQAGRELGVQWNVFNSRMAANIGSRQPAGNLPITAPTSPTNIPVGEVAAGVLSGASPFGFMLGRMIAGGTTIDVLINALEQTGLVRTLAEPNLTALSGDTASFLAGGEIPIPVAQSGSNNQITVEWKRYGVGLAFTPTVLNDGLINLKIEPEVSQLDPNNQVSVGAGLPPIPALHRAPRRDHDRAARRPELHDRRPAAERGARPTSSRFRGSAACRCSASCSRAAPTSGSETDLAIIVTPRLVRPARPGDVDQDAARQHAAGQRRRLLPDGQCRALARAISARCVGHGMPFSWTHPRSAEGRHQCRRGQELRRSLWSS